MTNTKPESPTVILAAHLDRFRAPLTGLIASWGAPWSDARELAQDSFAEAYVRRTNCRGDWRSPDFFGRWLRGVARNKFRSWVRKRERDSVMVAWSLEAHDVSDGDRPDEKIERQERDDRVRAAILALPTRQREVVVMRYYHDTPVAEIARLLGTTERAVEGRLYQARARLRTHLEEKKLPTNKIRGVLACL